MPSSRPKPDCLKPPNGVETRTELFELTERTPVSSARATRSARAPSRVQIEPESPYGVSFAIATASASSANGISAATGPNTSSRAIRSSFDASTSVHGNQKPGPSGTSPWKSGVALDERGDGLAVRGGDERAHLGRVVLRVADPHVARRLDEQLGEAVVDGALDEDPRARAAVLARVVEHGVRRGGGGLLEVGVGEDDVGRLAAELERDALDRPRRAAHHLLPDLGRAGEADLGDVGVLDQPLPDDRALADDDVDDALGEAGLEREVAEPDRGQRRELGGLEHDGVPARERGAELPARDVEREVPGHDQPDDAERLAEGHVDAAGDRDRLAVVLVDGARVVVEDLRDHADLAARARDRLADVARLDAAPAPRGAPRRASRAVAAGAPGRSARPCARRGTPRARPRRRRRFPPLPPARAGRAAAPWPG